MWKKKWVGELLSFRYLPSSGQRREAGRLQRRVKDVGGKRKVAERGQSGRDRETGRENGS